MVRLIYKYIRNQIYIIRYKLKNKHILFTGQCHIDKKCCFEEYNRLHNSILSSCFLGRGTYVGSVDFVNVKVGRFCSIGTNVRNTRGNHPTSVFVSTHPSFFSKGKTAGFTFSAEQKYDELKFTHEKYLVEIGNDVWIGDNVTILDGIKIGDGAIIGAGSLITKDIEPYSINIGIPAKKIKYRFRKDEIDFLMDFKWWNYDICWLKKNADIFDNIEEFIEKVNNIN